MAGLSPVGVIGEIVDEKGALMRSPELREFADLNGLTMISIEDLILYRRRHERQVFRQAETILPTEHGVFQAYGYRDEINGTEHMAVVYGDPGSENVLVRMHSECLTGDAFGSLRCDCGPQLDAALNAIAANGSGALVYLRGHEGRGIGLVAKLQAYSLQDTGRDTVDANTDLGYPADARNYGAAAQMLRDLNINSVRLITNNPDKIAQLEELGIKVSAREVLYIKPTKENLRYLNTKAQRMGHQLHDLDVEE